MRELEYLRQNDKNQHMDDRHRDEDIAAEMRQEAMRGMTAPTHSTPTKTLGQQLILEYLQRRNAGERELKERQLVVNERRLELAKRRLELEKQERLALVELMKTIVSKISLSPSN